MDVSNNPLVGDIYLYIEALRNSFLPYFKDIQDFRIYYDNPLLWVFFMVTFLALVIARSWSHRKAFFFCTVITTILLSATWFEVFISGAFVKPGETFDPFVIRLVAFIMISSTVLFFVLIDNS